MNPKKQAYKNLANTLIEKFKMRGFEGYYAEDADEALEIAKGLFTPGCSITWGGSATIKEISLLDALENSDYNILDRAKVPVEEQAEFYSKAVMADFFLMSSNAITLDGELVNIDGSGNRVACLITGPKNVIIVAGMNKIATDVESAIERVHNVASPPNTVRLNKNTPCSKTGKCGKCLGDDCICCQTVITRKSRIPGRIKIILVGEELGY